MAQRTMLAEYIDTVGVDAKLDAVCKRLIANKLILAWIMKYTLKEYHDYDVDVIAEQFIEGEPSISGQAVHRDVRSIRGEDTVDRTITEGTAGFLSRLSVNKAWNLLLLQNDFRTVWNGKSLNKLLIC